MIMKQPFLKIVDGKVTTTSRAVAEFFCVRHKAVSADIRKVILPEASKDFFKLNFESTLYTIVDRGIEVNKRQYVMTSKGFGMLTLIFKGKKTVRLKEAYLEAFYEMEALLNQAKLNLQLIRAMNGLMLGFSRVFCAFCVFCVFFNY
ncbi:MAG: hypothetical protein DRR16_23210 [Candidatus Parabeggiatoa sp. nov. 3]|jgi:Rha family phage regulatory protein|nr:MAG: hypothetical protein DRR00_18775 [Gammaproteobacteria bacterium]RKZ60734.1 MAG: hypothetical protein DRQ99_21615 [Gammaproteobacteria bacterium]RKZ80823.1 MAG: hypothetical protein DRR16_23210 [Gammaproteobacteria bacterium]HEW97088.1 hypothetical protein [Beggiatoa sp.]